jgi:D-glycero-D-manno-heptose 1,7-bisphosphate phosphatase
MKLVLIDRDGVINEELPGYVTKPEELNIYPQTLEAFALFKKAGFTAVIITNQSVVGRGIISEEQLGHIHRFLKDRIARQGGEVQDILVCTDRPDKASERRKPGAGMLLEALKKYGATPEETPFIGDALTDMEAAHKAHCPRYLVMTGKGHQTAQNMPLSLYPVTVCTDILDAAEKITGGK